MTNIISDRIHRLHLGSESIWIRLLSCSGKNFLSRDSKTLMRSSQVQINVLLSIQIMAPFEVSRYVSPFKVELSWGKTNCQSCQQLYIKIQVAGDVSVY